MKKFFKIIFSFFVMTCVFHYAPVHAEAADDDGVTSLLMHMDGDNNSTTFIDETGKAVTVHGDIKISNVQSITFYHIP